MGVDPANLQGRWTHSHEEDGPRTLVYRPSGWDFPPSRGRRSFDLRADGSVESGGPGPDDRTRVQIGHWRLLPGDILELIEPGKETRLLLVKAAKDKLVFDRS
jgi:hypothetical protein